LQGLVDWLLDFKTDGFEQSFEKAKEKAEFLGIDLDFGFNYRITRNKRPRRFEQNEGENQQATAPLANNLQKFKAEFFDEVLEKIIVEFKGTFDSIKMIQSEFGFMWGQVLESSNISHLTLKAKELATKYQDDLDQSAMLQEITFLKSAVKPFIEDGKTLKASTALEVLDILTMNGLHQQFNNIHTALRIFLTIPVSVASNERAFSKH